MAAHNHGPADGAGLDCPEQRQPDGSLKGRCLAVQAVATSIAKVYLMECGFDEVDAGAEARDTWWRDWVREAEAAIDTYELYAMPMRWVLGIVDPDSLAPDAPPVGTVWQLPRAPS